MKFLILSVVFMATTQAASAKVWNSTQEFNESWYQAYSNWVATDVAPTFFKDLGTPFIERFEKSCLFKFLLLDKFAERYQSCQP